MVSLETAVKIYHTKNSLDNSLFTTDYCPVLIINTAEMFSFRQHKDETFRKISWFTAIKLIHSRAGNDTLTVIL
jgi:hypothetical protein